MTRYYQRIWLASPRWLAFPILSIMAWSPLVGAPPPLEDPDGPSQKQGSAVIDGVEPAVYLEKLESEGPPPLELEPPAEPAPGATAPVPATVPEAPDVPSVPNVPEPVVSQETQTPNQAASEATQTEEPPIEDEKAAATEEASDLPVPPASVTPEVVETEAMETPEVEEEKKTNVATITLEELKEHETMSASTKEYLEMCLSLTRMNLVYKYGGANPSEGGMDCSGFVYHVLREIGYKSPPRASNGQYSWVRRDGTFHAVLGSKDDTFELDDMTPGDLMFWTNTYAIERDIPITHVMVYLGTRKSDGQRVMVGASEGRRYDGEARYGVSVFEFQLSRQGRGSFVGYGSLPAKAE
ncbi:MAG: NlpC/P60 family protein [Verrucomicrobiales bacterium]